MENSIFLRPAVADRMQKGFVEARLHTDIKSHLTDEQFATNRKLQRDLAGITANPYYVVVDAKTGAVLGRHGLSGGPGAWEPGWIVFLDAMLQAGGKN